MFWNRAGQRLACIASLCLASAVPAGAHERDHVAMRVPGLVVVWAADPAGGVPIVSDFVIDSDVGGNNDADLIADDVFTVVTGDLVAYAEDYSAGEGSPVVIRRPLGGPNFVVDTNNDMSMDASDSFSAFGLRRNTDTNIRRAEINTSFYVASNAAFHIDAVVTPVGATTVTQLDRVRGILSVTLSGDDGVPFGAAAQYPHSAGPTGGRRMNGRRLSSMLTAFNVFRGNQATAASRGTLAEQSVRFDLTYRYGFGNIDLSAGTLDVEAEVIYTVYMP
mgnify:CR=1 FL=1